MKRSEMLELIASNLFTIEPIDSSLVFESWDSLDPDVRQIYIDNANLILSLIEKAGMQPPNVTLTQLFPNVNIEIAEMHSKHFYAVWEPEDE